MIYPVDSAIHRIYLYPVDSVISFPNTYPLDSDLSRGERYPTFEQPGPDVFKFRVNWRHNLRLSAPSRVTNCLTLENNNQKRG